MGNVDLIAELRRALHSYTLDEMRADYRAGVPVEAINAGIVGAGNALPDGQPHPAGARVRVLAVCGEGASSIPWESNDPRGVVLGGDLIDLLVVWPDGRFVTRAGAADVIGVMPPQLVSPERVRVRRCPWAWMRAGCDGAVLVGDRISQRRALLTFTGGVTGDDEDHSRELAKAMRLPRPRVFFVRKAA